MKNSIKYIILTFILSTLFLSVDAQFYNGLQMNFGKNRVQYGEFVWQYYRFKRFDTYFYVGGKELAEFTGKTADKKIREMEDMFDYSLDKRIIFITYNKLSDFRQSNIGLVSGDNQYNIGGVTKIVDNKVFLYFEGDHKKMEEQITAAVAEVMLNEMLYGSDLKNKLANSTLLSLPDWFIKGLISYVSKGWNYDIENKVKDGILSGRYEKFNHLMGEDAVYAGHSIWNYIGSTFGKNIIPTILYITRVSKNVESGFMFVLGVPLKYLAKDWVNYYDNEYYKTDTTQNKPSGKLVKKRPKRKRVYQQLRISPDGKKIAYQTNELGQYKIWLYDIETNKRKKIIKEEHKLDQINDYSFPVIRWHPSGKLFSYLTEEEGKFFLSSYNLEEENINKRGLFSFDKILDYSYSPNGLDIVLSAVKKGNSDIYIHNIIANTNEQITKDNADNLNPKYINDKEIIFSSNRISDTLFFGSKDEIETSNFHDIFTYNIKDKTKTLKRITETEYVNETKPSSLGENNFTFLSDENGIINRYAAKYDSTISFIDTSIHYRYFTNPLPITNLKRNILDQDINTSLNKTTNIIYYKGKYKMYLDTLDLAKVKNQKLPLTKYRTKINRYYFLTDSLAEVERLKTPEEPIEIDSSIIDINNYIFEEERQNKSLYSTDGEYDEYGNLIIPDQRMYSTSFYANYIVNQVDFSFLNTSYQPYTAGAAYFNPQINMLFKVGTNDLFEDYKIIGGVRFAGNFDSNEYLLSFENLKDRLDKQIVLHRQAYESAIAQQFALIKTHYHEIHYILTYPFSQVTAIKATISGRNDRTVYLSTDNITLNAKNSYKTWGGLKLEYIFDNTRQRAINIYFGSRYKIFGEFYHQVDKRKTDLFVFGADFRHYLQIHRNIILASRIAGSTSLGHQRLIYFMGGTDNWWNLNARKNPTFDQTVQVDTTQNFAYQTIATNMRGFTQNIRNGNSFIAINNEIRWPIISYFLNRPINSDFLANFQLVGFYDIGTAWNGLSPFDKQPYEEEVIENGPITIFIDKHKNPIVMGYGFGLRTKMLGYFVRTDWAWGIENNVILPRIFYLSLSLDF